MTVFSESAQNLLQMYMYDILDLFQDGIYISNSAGDTLMVNTTWEKLTGIAAATVIGKNVHDLKRQGVFNTIVNPEVVATAKKVTSVQLVNGCNVVLHGTPIFDSEGQVELVVTFVRDITAFGKLKEKIATQKALVEAYKRQLSHLNPEDIFLNEGMVAVSPESLIMLAHLDNIAPTDATLLVLGETGVGKEVISRRIHRKSLRAEASFVKVDCSAIPENLVESELFGYSAGAFSGARARGKQGFFEKANGGTLFLDEIGELSLPMQTRLLRAIQDQEIVRVGSTRVTPIDVRIVAATNRDLEHDVETGKFRSDLFYRLNVAVVNIPPLRERRDDILPLARVFLHRFNRKYAKQMYLSSGAENILFKYAWPGNVRELENLIHSIVISRTKPKIRPKNLPEKLSSGVNASSISTMTQSFDIGKQPLKEMIRNIERDMINEAVAIYGSVAKAAEVLQVNRSTIFRKTKGGSPGACKSKNPKEE